VTFRSPDPSALAPLLEEWLPQQRWFGGRGTATVHAVRVAGRLTNEPFVSDLVLVETPGGTYQVPLLYRRDWDDILAHVHIGTLETGGERLEVYDALHDKAVTGAWIRGLAEASQLDGIRFDPAVEASELPLDEVSLVVSAEQSNTSLIFGHAAILKVFRRVEPGRNPDIEVHAALAARGGRHIARMLGHVEATWAGPDGPVTADVAMLQDFLQSATDGWQLAQISVRDLMAEGDLHADEVGGDFAAESRRLGVATAETHADLAQALPTGSYDRAGLRALAQAMRERLDQTAAQVDALEPYVDAIRMIFDRVAKLRGPVPAQRVHGDYHLGQVMRTTQRWVLLDFEGEPLKPFAERVGLDSPLRDIAGMLRSFDYAGRHLLADRPHEPQIAYRAEEWANRNRDAFLDGYAEGAGSDVRADPQLGVLLAAYEVDKAVYEVQYEASHRPSWISIPLAAVARLAAPTSSALTS
jgi:maltokinase